MIKRKEFDGKRKKTVTRIHSLKEFIKPAKEEKKLYSQKKSRLKRIKKETISYVYIGFHLERESGERKVKNKVSEL